MSRRHWALVVVLILVNYIVFASLFDVVFSSRPGSAQPTRTPLPTFTPAPPPTPLVLAPTNTLVPPSPTPTPTLVMVTPDTPTPELPPPTEPSGSTTESPPAETPASSGPSVTVDVNLNVRTGPGTNYERIGALAEGSTVNITGRDVNSAWWQIPYPDAPGGKGWISAGYGAASNTDGVPVVEAPPTPTPAAPTAPPTAEAPPPAATPAYQYTPTGWYGDTNYGLTRFMGDIRDTAGNPVDGVFVRAACGTFSTISYPSGPVGWGGQGDSSDWPPGFYDIAVDSKPVPCMWTLQVVATDDRVNVKSELSEAVPVEVTMDQSIIQANWQKNW
ncbi:MAG: SH3 domain-containing protein [Anaerolineales bacterium]|nr:MAG: SH3 domain-containing protein [Anaerolineales bacterium]